MNPISETAKTYRKRTQFQSGKTNQKNTIYKSSLAPMDSAQSKSLKIYLQHASPPSNKFNN